MNGAGRGAEASVIVMSAFSVQAWRQRSAVLLALSERSAAGPYETVSGSPRDADNDAQSTRELVSSYSQAASFEHRKSQLITIAPAMPKR
jgi:hypothetical protein